MRALFLSHLSNESALSVSSPSPPLRSKINIARFYCASPITPSRFLSISSTRGLYTRFQPSLLSVKSKTMSSSSSSQCSVSRETTSTESGEASRAFNCLDVIRTLTESGRFKAWFLDQYGVLHDGKKPYPGAISTLEKLAATGAKMVIISNSSRRAVVTDDKLKSLGFDPSLFLGALTSGELTHQFLLRRDDPWFAALGRKCIHMTWNDRGPISLEGLGLEVVSRVDDAEFILAHGTEALGLPSGGSEPMDLEGLEQILELCAKRQKPIPMVVANPDYVTVEARNLCVMPGALLLFY
ncbi:uncharacterized protein LOC144548099 isoform X2 [Carex rostrata]